MIDSRIVDEFEKLIFLGKLTPFRYLLLRIALARIALAFSILTIPYNFFILLILDQCIKCYTDYVGLFLLYAYKSSSRPDLAGTGTELFLSGGTAFFSSSLVPSFLTGRRFSKNPSPSRPNLRLRIHSSYRLKKQQEEF